MLRVGDRVALIDDSSESGIVTYVYDSTGMVRVAFDCGKVKDVDDYLLDFLTPSVIEQDGFTTEYSSPTKSPQHYGQGPIESDGGPAAYYDFDPKWKTWNDLADHKAEWQWGKFSFHLGNIGKALMRWGDKSGASVNYDTRKIIYSGLRVLLMMEGKESVRTYLKNLLNDTQFRD